MSVQGSTTYRENRDIFKCCFLHPFALHSHSAAILPTPALKPTHFYFHSHPCPKHHLSLLNFVPHTQTHIPSPSHRAVKAILSFIQRLQSLPGVLKIKLKPWSPIRSSPVYLSVLALLRSLLAISLSSSPTLIPTAGSVLASSLSFKCLPLNLLFLLPGRLCPEPDLPKDGSASFRFRFRRSSLRLFWSTLPNDTPLSHFLSHASLLFSSQKLGLFLSYALLYLQCPALASANFSHAVTCYVPGTILGNKDSGK